MALAALAGTTTSGWCLRDSDLAVRYTARDRGAWWCDPPEAYPCVEETKRIVHRLVQIVTQALAVGLLVSSVALAGDNSHKSLTEEQFEGTVIRVDAKGGVTIKTMEGTERTVQGIGLQGGDKIACGRYGEGMCNIIREKTK